MRQETVSKIAQGSGVARFEGSWLTAVPSVERSGFEGEAINENFQPPEPLPLT